LLALILTLTVISQLVYAQSCGTSTISAYGTSLPGQTAVTCNTSILASWGSAYTSTQRSWVLSAYNSYANRCPEQSGFVSWLSKIASNGWTQAQLNTEFQKSVAQVGYFNPCGSTATYSGYSSNTCTVTLTGCCSLPWGGVIQNGNSTTAYFQSSVPYGSSCSAQTRTCSNGSLGGSYTNQSCYVQAAANCPSTYLNWGSSNFCSGYASSTSSGNGLSLTNSTAGAAGSAYASCYNGTWSISSTSCSVSLSAPASVSATDGTVAGKVTVTWGAVSGASGYDVQYRVQGSGSWTLASGVTSGWQLPTADQSTYEFQVRAKIHLGSAHGAARIRVISPGRAHLER